jgi:colicin import membrane protein
MPWYARDQVRPLLGSAALHLLFLAVIIAAAVNWRSEPPPAPLAIEGDIVRYEDLPRSLRDGKPIVEPQEKAPVTVTEPKPEPEREPEHVDPQRAIEPEPVDPPPQAKPEPDPAATAEAQRAQEAADALQRQQAEQKIKAAEALAAQQRADAEAQRKAADDAKRQAEADAAAAAEQAARQQLEKEEAARVARLKSEREAALRRELALEEEGEAVAQSGVVDEYRALLVQTIERNWNRPPTAKAGLECTLHVTQATGGTVIDVKIGDCNADAAVRDSVMNAVYRSSPLPAPRDSRAFQRQLVIVFKPTE